MLIDPPDYSKTLGKFFYDTSDDEANDAPDDKANDAPEDTASGGTKVDELAPPLAPNASKPSYTAVDAPKKPTTAKDSDSTSEQEESLMKKEGTVHYPASPKAEPPKTIGEPSAIANPPPLSTTEKLLRLSEAGSRSLYPSAKALAFLFEDPKKRALEEKIDRDVFESLERFFVPFPWSVVPKFLSLLVRSLNLDYTSVFCTADFVRRVRRVSKSLIRKDPIRTAPQTAEDLQTNPPLTISDEATLSKYLRSNVLNLISACSLGVSWCVEKASMILRAKARLNVFDVLQNDVSTTNFVTLCKFVLNDARVNARRKFSPPNVLQFQESEKQTCIQYFINLKGTAPPQNISRELSVFSVNKPNARRVAAFSDKEKIANLLETLKTRGVDFEKLYRRNPDEIGRVFEAAIDIFPMDPTLGTPHYTDPMYGYFIRLVDEATSRGLGYETDSYDIAFEEIHPINFLAMGFLETYINDRLGPAANCMRIALFAVAAATGREKQTWNQVLVWCIQDRDRLVQFVELVALHRNLDRVVDRTSAALEPVVARRMETSIKTILAWFQEINNTVSK